MISDIEFDDKEDPNKKYSLTLGDFFDFSVRLGRQEAEQEFRKMIKELRDWAYSHRDDETGDIPYEEIDKKNIVHDYPRIYGKKYKCGKCGGFWKISPTLE